MLFQPELETQSQDEREALQRERLRALLPRFEVDADTALADAPFTVKSQLRDAYPFGLLQVPLEQVPQPRALEAGALLRLLRLELRLERGSAPRRAGAPRG